MENRILNTNIDLSNMPLATLFEQSGLGMIIVDGNGGIIQANLPFCKIVDYPREEIITMSLESLMADEDIPRCAEPFQDLLRGRTEHLLLDCRFIRRNERLRWLHLSMTKISDGAAGDRCVFGIVEDVTKVKQIQEDLIRSKESAEEATKVKSEFLANMSHEIRTPIHTIIGMGELLEETTLDDEQKEYASQIEFAADVLLNLVNNILDFSKIEAGKLTLEVIDFDISRIAEETVDLISLEAHRKELEIITWVSPSLPKVFRGDPHRIRQIIVNLAKNAVKFTETGEILLTVKSLGVENGRHSVRFAVKDTGIGIPADKQDLLFQSFTQVDSSTTRRFGGTGLGLTISRNLTHLMKGKIGVQSTPEKGSTFWFVLPLEPGVPKGETVGGEARELKGVRVLIVDDNKGVQKALTSYLMYWGCRVDFAVDGREALSKLKNAADTPQRFDVVLIDAQLPGIDGWQLAGEISSDKSINYLKLVLLTPAGKSGDEAKMKLLHWFDDYLSKPVRSEQIRDTLIRVTSQAIDLETVDVDELPSELAGEGKAENPIRILLAEDHVVNQELFRTILEKMGYQIQVAFDGNEAVALANEESYDLIFMDVQMPKMNGLEATRALREQGKKMPIIAVTANATRAEMEKCRDAGMDDFIGKPFKKKDLVPVLGKWTAKIGIETEEEESVQEDDSAGKQIFDFQRAVETFLGNEDTVRNVLKAYTEKLDKDILQLKTAHAEKNMEALSQVAHGIKGGSLNLEVNRLGRAAAALEQAGKEEKDQDVENAYQQTLSAYDEFKKHVTKRYPA